MMVSSRDGPLLAVSAMLIDVSEFWVACREYASLKVVTEQDVYNRMRKEQKREAKRQKMYTV